jgi:alkylhydroperoxidase family enzyme
MSAIDELRAMPASIDRPPPAMESYLGKVRRRAYTVTDGEVEELKAAGCSEDEIFEQTVAVAVEEGLRRLDAGMRVLG